MNSSSAISTRLLTTGRYYNRANGVYIISVSAVDEVGNVSQPVSALYILNKFQPSTYVTSIQQQKNDMGDSTLVINGGGFTYDGSVSEIYIDADGKAPYDLVLSLTDEKYRLTSDSKISGVQLGNELDEGKYKIGLLHSDRGLYFTDSILTISQNGTLKIEAEILQISFFFNPISK